MSNHDYDEEVNRGIRPLNSEYGNTGFKFTAERDRRIRQLEELNKVLTAEVDRMRPVVDAAIKWNETNYRDMKECELALDAIGNACDDYESSKPK